MGKKIGIAAKVEGLVYLGRNMTVQVLKNDDAIYHGDTIDTLAGSFEIIVDKDRVKVPPNLKFAISLELVRLLKEDQGKALTLIGLVDFNHFDMLKKGASNSKYYYTTLTVALAAVAAAKGIEQVYKESGETETTTEGQDGSVVAFYMQVIAGLAVAINNILLNVVEEDLSTSLDATDSGSEETQTLAELLSDPLSFIEDFSFYDLFNVLGLYPLNQDGGVSAGFDSSLATLARTTEFDEFDVPLFIQTFTAEFTPLAGPDTFGLFNTLNAVVVTEANINLPVVIDLNPALINPVDELNVSFAIDNTGGSGIRVSGTGEEVAFAVDENNNLIGTTTQGTVLTIAPTASGVLTVTQTAFFDQGTTGRIAPNEQAVQVQFDGSDGENDFTQTIPLSTLVAFEDTPLSLPDITANQIVENEQVLIDLPLNQVQGSIENQAKAGFNVVPNSLTGPGTLTQLTPNQLQFTPAGGQEGTPQFQVAFQDGGGGQALFDVMVPLQPDSAPKLNFSNFTATVENNLLNGGEGGNPNTSGTFGFNTGNDRPQRIQIRNNNDDFFSFDPDLQGTLSIPGARGNLNIRKNIQDFFDIDYEQTQAFEHTPGKLQDFVDDFDVTLFDDDGSSITENLGFFSDDDNPTTRFFVATGPKGGNVLINIPGSFGADGPPANDEDAVVFDFTNFTGLGPTPFGDAGDDNPLTYNYASNPGDPNLTEFLFQLVDKDGSTTTFETGQLNLANGPQITFSAFGAINEDNLTAMDGNTDAQGTLSFNTANGAPQNFRVENALGDFLNFNVGDTLSIAGQRGTLDISPNGQEFRLNYTLNQNLLHTPGVNPGIADAFDFTLTNSQNLETTQTANFLSNDGGPTARFFSVDGVLGQTVLLDFAGQFSPGADGVSQTNPVNLNLNTFQGLGTFNDAGDNNPLTFSYQSDVNDANVLDVPWQVNDRDGSSNAFFARLNLTAAGTSPLTVSDNSISENAEPQGSAPSGLQNATTGTITIANTFDLNTLASLTYNDPEFGPSDFSNMNIGDTRPFINLVFNDLSITRTTDKTWTWRYDTQKVARFNHVDQNNNNLETLEIENIEFKLNTTSNESFIDPLIVTSIDDKPISAQFILNNNRTGDPVTFDLESNLRSDQTFPLIGKRAVGLDDVDFSDSNSITFNLIEGQGTFTNNLDGTFTYTPPDANEMVARFTYTLTDGDNSVSDPSPESRIGFRNVITTLPPGPIRVFDEKHLPNGSDPDAEQLSKTNNLTYTLSSGFLDTLILGTRDLFNTGQAQNTFDLAQMTIGDGSTLDVTPTVSANNTLTFTRPEDARWTNTYTLVDAHDHRLSQAFTNPNILDFFQLNGTSTDNIPLTNGIQIDVIDDKPIAKDFTVTGTQNQALNIDFNTLATPGADGLASINITSNNANQFVDNGNGTATFTPNAGQTGVVSFTYLLIDGDDSESESSATGTISMGPDAPIINREDLNLSAGSNLAQSSNTLNPGNPNEIYQVTINTPNIDVSRIINLPFLKGIQMDYLESAQENLLLLSGSELTLLNLNDAQLTPIATDEVIPQASSMVSFMKNGNDFFYIPDDFTDQLSLYRINTQGSLSASLVETLPKFTLDGGPDHLDFSGGDFEFDQFGRLHYFSPINSAQYRFVRLDVDTNSAVTVASFNGTDPSYATFYDSANNNFYATQTNPLTYRTVSITGTVSDLRAARVQTDLNGHGSVSGNGDGASILTNVVNIPLDISVANPGGNESISSFSFELSDNTQTNLAVNGAVLTYQGATLSNGDVFQFDPGDGNMVSALVTIENQIFTIHFVNVLGFAGPQTINHVETIKTNEFDIRYSNEQQTNFNLSLSATTNIQTSINTLGTTSTPSTVTYEVDINDKPSASDESLTLTNATPYVFGIDDFSFTDADAGDALQAIKIVSLPDKAELQYNDPLVNGGFMAVTLNEVILRKDLTEGNFRLVTEDPSITDLALNENTQFSFQVHDGALYSDTANFTVTRESPPALVNNTSGFVSEQFVATALLNPTEADFIRPNNTFVQNGGNGLQGGQTVQANGQPLVYEDPGTNNTMHARTGPNATDDGVFAIQLFQNKGQFAVDMVQAIPQYSLADGSNFNGLNFFEETNITINGQNNLDFLLTDLTGLGLVIANGGLSISNPWFSAGDAVSIQTMSSGVQAVDQFNLGIKGVAGFTAGTEIELGALSSNTTPLDLSVTDVMLINSQGKTLTQGTDYKIGDNGNTLILAGLPQEAVIILGKQNNALSPFDTVTVKNADSSTGRYAIDSISARTHQELDDITTRANFTDAGGQTSSDELNFKLVTPLTVGTNIVDNPASTTNYAFGEGQGAIMPPLKQFNLVGDEGGSDKAASNVNLSLLIDSSAFSSIQYFDQNTNNPTGFSFLGIQQQAGTSLLEEYINRGNINDFRVHIQHFNSQAQNSGIFNVIENGQVNTANLDAAKALIFNPQNPGGGRNPEHALLNTNAVYANDAMLKEGPGLPEVETNVVLFLVNDPTHYVTGDSDQGTIAGFDITESVNHVTGTAASDLINDVTTLNNTIVNNVDADFKKVRLGIPEFNYDISTFDNFTAIAGAGQITINQDPTSLFPLIGTLGSTTLNALGNDEFNIDTDSNVAFLDALNVDALLAASPFDFMPGESFQGLQALEQLNFFEAGSNELWTVDKTLDFIKDPANRFVLAQETMVNNIGRTGGDDTAVISGNNNFIFAQEGDDTLRSLGNNNYLSVGSGSNTVNITAGSAKVDLRSGDPTLNVDGNGAADRVNLTVDQLTNTGVSLLGFESNSAPNPRDGINFQVDPTLVQGLTPAQLGEFFRDTLIQNLQLTGAGSDTSLMLTLNNANNTPVTFSGLNPSKLNNNATNFTEFQDLFPLKVLINGVEIPYRSDLNATDSKVDEQFLPLGNNPNATNLTVTGSIDFSLAANDTFTSLMANFTTPAGAVDLGALAIGSSLNNVQGQKGTFDFTRASNTRVTYSYDFNTEVDNSLTQFAEQLPIVLTTSSGTINERVDITALDDSPRIGAAFSTSGAAGQTLNLNLLTPNTTTGADGLREYNFSNVTGGNVSQFSQNNGAVTFTPLAGQSGQVTFQYTITDSDLSVSPANSGTIVIAAPVVATSKIVTNTPGFESPLIAYPSFAADRTNQVFNPVVDTRVKNDEGNLLNFGRTFSYSGFNTKDLTASVGHQVKLEDTGFQVFMNQDVPSLGFFDGSSLDGITQNNISTPVNINGLLNSHPIEVSSSLNNFNIDNGALTFSSFKFPASPGEILTFKVFNEAVIPTEPLPISQFNFTVSQLENSATGIFDFGVDVRLNGQAVSLRPEQFRVYDESGNLLTPGVDHSDSRLFNNQDAVTIVVGNPYDETAERPRLSFDEISFRSSVGSLTAYQLDAFSARYFQPLDVIPIDTINNGVVETISFELVEPWIVGSNASDISGSTTVHLVNGSAGVITNPSGQFTLAGDSGGRLPSSLQPHTLGNDEFVITGNKNQAYLDAINFDEPNELNFNNLLTTSPIDFIELLGTEGILSLEQLNVFNKNTGELITREKILDLLSDENERFALATEEGAPGGNDTATVTGDNNYVFGQEGNDNITLSGKDNYASGGTGSDTVVIQSGNATVDLGSQAQDPANATSVNNNPDGAPDIVTLEFNNLDGLTRVFDFGKNEDQLRLNTDFNSTPTASNLRQHLDEIISSLFSSTTPGSESVSINFVGGDSVRLEGITPTFLNGSGNFSTIDHLAPLNIFINDLQVPLS